MDLRSLVLIAALAVSGAGLAGCIEAPGFLSSDAETTALESRAVADEAAKAWNPAAQLASVMTLELTNSSDARIPSDPEVGNGRAPAWWFVYCLETEAGMDVKAFRVMDGVATEESDANALATQAPMDSMDAIKDWTVDSDAAIEKAKTDERFRLAAQGFNATVVSGVARHDAMTEYATADDAAAGGADGGEQAAESDAMAHSDTIWWIVAGSVDGIVVALVDANSGALIEVKDLDFGFAMPEIDFASASVDTFAPEPIHVEATDELDGEAMEYPFEVSYPMSGDMDFTFESGDPLHGARWWIVDENDEPVASSGRGWWMGGDREAKPHVDIEMPGIYRVVVAPSNTVFFAPVPTQGPVTFEFVLHLDPVGEEADEDEASR